MRFLSFASRGQVLIALSLVVGSLDAQAPEQQWELGAPLMTLAAPLTQTAGLAELADGRLLVIDSRERLVLLASRDGKTVTPFGTAGEGPLEYRMPFGVNRARGDTLLVYDAGNRRYLKVSSSGRIAGELPIPAVFLMRGGFAPPRGIDAEGRIYWIGDVVGMGGPQGAKRNQLHILRRWTPGREVLDSVAKVSDHAPELHARQFHPIAERDAVVIAADGRVGVLSAREYRLRWSRDGATLAEGPSLSHDPVPVTAVARAAYRRERALNPAGSRMSGPPSSEPAPTTVRRMEDAYPDDLFPTVKPPFVENGARLTPAEEIWVTRSSVDGAPRVRIDVLANTGARRGHLLLPPGRRLVALERGGVYLARADEDGFEWIERYAWPAGLR